MRALLLTAIVLPLLTATASAGSYQETGEPGSVTAKAARSGMSAVAVSRTGRRAYGMEVGPSFGVDLNSRAATGGGSLGYNRKLLEY